jgi:hypothetical protein
MRQRCEDNFPQLKAVPVDSKYPFMQGLRPCKGLNLRVEREPRHKRVLFIDGRISHSYGHGGSVWNLAFGGG